MNKLICALLLVGTSGTLAAQHNKADHTRYVQNIAGTSLSFSMEAIPEGSFIMGDDKSVRKDEKPAHEVEVDAFWMGTHEVTWDLFQSFLYKDYEQSKQQEGAVVTSQCCHFEGSHNRVDETFQGTKGKIYLSAGGRAVLWDTKGNEIYNHDPKGNPNPYRQEHVELFEAIAKGEYKFNNAEYGAYSSLAGIIGRLACYTGKVIKWDEALKSNVDLMPVELSWNANPKVLPDANGLYAVAVPGINTDQYI